VRGGAIQETAVVALDGKIYVLGGFDGSLAVVKSVRIFDTATCTWSDGPELPRAMHHMNAAVAGDTIYVLGGMDGLSFTPLGDVYAWNPKQAAGWVAKTGMPAGSARGSAFIGTIGDVIYVAGGLRSGAVTTFSSYSTTNDTWDANLPPLPQARDHGCGGVVGGKLYALGGRAGSITSQSPLVFEYTPGGAWVQKTSMPTARGGTACGVIGDRIIVTGGEGNSAIASGVFAEVEAYTVSTDSWAALPPMTTPRHGMGAAVSGGVFYVPGGATKQGFGAVDTHEALRP
jgi:N-acetylneuraminic acid mutarotase